MSLSLPGPPHDNLSEELRKHADRVATELQFIASRILLEKDRPEVAYDPDGLRFGEGLLLVPHERDVPTLGRRQVKTVVFQILWEVVSPETRDYPSESDFKIVASEVPPARAAKDALIAFVNFTTDELLRWWGNR